MLAVDIFTNPYAIRLKHVAKEMRKKQDQKIQEDRQFQDGQLDKQIEAQASTLASEREHQINIVNLKGEWQYKEAYLTAVGRDSSSTSTDDFDQITKAYQMNLKEKEIDMNYEFKREDMDRKKEMDIESKQMEIEKIKQKAEEFRIRREQMVNQKFIAIANKN